MKNKEKFYVVILVIVTVLVVTISYFMNREDQVDEIKIKIVTNYSDFYTVNSCLHRTVNYLSKQDKESVFSVLSDNYKKENNITKDNVLDIFGNVDQNTTFVSKKMYYEEINENLEKYYVEGYIEKNIIHDEQEFIDNTDMNNNYYIVYLDRENKIFSVEPYNGEIFKSGDINE